MHCLKVKSNKYRTMNMWGSANIGSPYIFNRGTVWKWKFSLCSASLLLDAS